MQQDPLVDAQIRSARYWNVDGLSEIAQGIWVLLIALCLYGMAHTSRGSLGRVISVLVFAFGLPAALFLSRRVLVAVRRRFTYRRTGFVEYRPDRRALVFGAGLAIAGAIVLLLLILMARGMNWIPYLFVLQGLVPGVLTIYLGRLLGLIRFQVTGAVYIVLGAAVALAAPGLTEGMMAFWSGIGVLYLLSGGLTFWRYTRLHPNVAEAR